MQVDWNKNGTSFWEAHPCTFMLADNLCLARGGHRHRQNRHRSLWWQIHKILQPFSFVINFDDWFLVSLSSTLDREGFAVEFLITSGRDLCCTRASQIDYYRLGAVAGRGGRMSVALVTWAWYSVYTPLALWYW